MKTLRFIALICAIALIFSGCSWQSITPPTTTIADGGKYLAAFEDYLQYQQLTAVEKSCYGIVYTSVYDQMGTETQVQDEDGKFLPGLRIPLGNANLSITEIARVFEAFYLDNPNFFFIDRTYSLEGREVNGTQVYDTLILRYTMVAEQRIAATQRFDQAVQTVLKNCPIAEDDYLIELYLHDTLLSRCTYDQAATESASLYSNAYSAYGALVEGKAVCEGYAKAMQWLLNSAAIPATVIRGYSKDNQTAHMWNWVEINDAYYYLDPTWNDSAKHPQYAYFNITSADLQRTHTIDAGTTLIVDCTAEKDNYFHRNGTYVSGYDRDTIANVIATQIQKGASAVYLRFADGKFENGLLFLKNATLTKKMVNAHLSSGAQMWSYEIQTDASQNTVSLFKTN